MHPSSAHSSIQYFNPSFLYIATKQAGNFYSTKADIIFNRVPTKKAIQFYRREFSRVGSPLPCNLFYKKTDSILRGGYRCWCFFHPLIVVRSICYTSEWSMYHERNDPALWQQSWSRSARDNDKKAKIEPIRNHQQLVRELPYSISLQKFYIELNNRFR